MRLTLMIVGTAMEMVCVDDACMSTRSVVNVGRSGYTGEICILTDDIPSVYLLQRCVVL